MKMQQDLEKRKIHYLTNLKVTVNKNIVSKLIVLGAEGYSINEQIGVPDLVRTNPANMLPDDGILEFDLLTEPVDYVKRKILNWTTEIVLDLNKLPQKLKGIKVNALHNSDIVLISI
jgi:hypothetical protein